jgi:aminoglycoside 3-N-acetyltransferase
VKQILANTPFPRTRESIRKELRDLGVTEEMALLVHSSLSSIGWVNGGAVAVIQALMDVVTEQGTIIMPAQSVDLSDPAGWQNPPIAKEWWSRIRETMPAYHPEYTPTTGMGKIVEVFRTFPGVQRSSHPAYSFVAWGKNKTEILAQHSLNFGLGEGSPLGKLYERGASTLLLGTGFDRNTCFHLAEYRVPHQELIHRAAPILEEGNRIWKEYQDLNFREDLFEEIGKDFVKVSRMNTGKIGSADAQLFSMRDAVDFAERWLANRHFSA